MLSRGGACLKVLAEHAQLTILKSPPEKVGTQKLLDFEVSYTSL